MRQTFFSLASLRRFWFHNTGEAYLCEGVTATSIVVLSFILVFTFVIKKEQPTMRQDFFSLAQSPRPSVSLLLVWLTYKRALPLPPSSCCLFILLYLHLSFYRFRNVSVRKCLIVQLAKFLMQLISISTNSLNEMKLSLRPIISTATRQ